jgi:hypothetical protein
VANPPLCLLYEWLADLLNTVLSVFVVLKAEIIVKKEHFAILPHKFFFNYF